MIPVAPGGTLGYRRVGTPVHLGAPRDTPGHLLGGTSPGGGGCPGEYCQEWEIDQLLQFCMHNFIFLIFAVVFKAKYSTNICPILEGVKMFKWIPRGPGEYCQEWEIDQLLQFCRCNFILMIFAWFFMAKYSINICPS